MKMDRQLVAALQRAPRAPWGALGQVLRCDPTTLARRWRTLTEEGVAWSTCFELSESPTRSHVRAALVEIGCVPGEREQVIAALAAEPLIYSIHCSTGDRDLVALVSGAHVGALDDVVQEQIAARQGVTSVRTHLIPTIFFDGPSWRLKALTEEQERAIEAGRPRRTVPAAPTALHRDLMVALNPDPRASVASLAGTLGCSTSTVSRGLDVLATAPWARVRIDVAHEHLGWEAEVQLNLQVPGGSLPLVVQTLRQVPDLRMCSSLSGPANLTAVFWLRRLYEMDTLEHTLASTHPSTTVLDRWVVTRVAKRMGHVLDASGRHSRFVPFEVPPAAGP